MTIEEQLLKKYGTTDVPDFAQWLLKDGTMVNGSFEGRQRDIDHLCISEFFKRSKYEDPGSAYIYVKKFMRRGNIRLCCDEYNYCAELMTVPTQEQFNTLKHIMHFAKCRGITTYIERLGANGKRRTGNWCDFVDYVERYTDLDTHQEEGFSILWD